MTNGDDPATIADLLDSVRQRDGVAFDASERSTPYSAREFATSSWKAGNLLRHYGVRLGSTVAVVVGPKAPVASDEPGSLGDAADPLIATLGATLLGGAVDLDPEPPVDGDALVAPAPWLDRFDTAPGCARIAYGGPPEAADVVHFEQAAWSQNPVAPPETERVSSDDSALVCGDDTADRSTWSHGDLLECARGFLARTDLVAGDRVAVQASLDPEVFAAGVLAPLLVGATVVGGADADGDVVVS